jgi:alpha-beta hydrolase superfamily lysophospholipase
MAADFDRPEEEAMRPHDELSFATADGVSLFYRHWPAVEAPARGAVVILHRGHEHSGRVAHLADELALPGFDLFAWDARGHGRSPGPRGHAPSFAALVRDLDAFVAHIGATHGFAVEDTAVVAQSVGAVVAATWVHDYAPKIRALVLASPAFRVRLYVPLARPGLRLLRRLRGNFDVQSYVKARMLTHDPSRAASFDADPLITRAISVDILLGLNDAAERVVADAAAITVPTQLLVSGSDYVVEGGPQHRFYERLGSRTKERHVLAGFYHDTLSELGRAPAVAAVRRFLGEQFERLPERPSLQDADRLGHTRAEADRLASPLPVLSPRGLFWATTRAGLKLGGTLSDGIRLGHATGFDSGATLDAVYRNQPSGRGAIGRAIDRAYLDSVGWRGIRTRKRHLEELIRDAMARLRHAGMPVHVLDIAAGHGRYVLEALEAGDLGRPDSILLRDYVPGNVEAGRRLIAEKGLSDIARFEVGDAFDPASLAALQPKPTLAIVSGLYELFADNDLVRWSLGGVAAAVPAGGFLVYTNQPWHPQLEFIARALTSHRGGQAWVMRRRTQGEMDELVESHGFTKLVQRIDDDGIFTVSLAQRVGDAG